MQTERNVAIALARTIEGMHRRFTAAFGANTYSVEELLYCPDHVVKDAAIAGVNPALIVDATRKDRLAAVIDALTSTLTGHLAHEERDGLPLIGVALTAAEWRSAGFKIARKNGLSAGGEMFAWILDGAGGEDAAATLSQLPPPLRLVYRAVWKPRFDKTPRW